ncbi:uncharacterized protein BXZ73DRAFT_99469 [Epithele typhae]|uniref:uncharacterized protein n=1 Tax=Epithele typhae TaxID=378194 RepID=UPI0020076F92|nr:uncharacterized protein BXZ73DRAFT_99469 [Epithele typhae]KAH9939266.1 hypothetical protein BXZ73DRAFT_99469 [Epithele typhae]
MQELIKFVLGPLGSWSRAAHMLSYAQEAAQQLRLKYERPLQVLRVAIEARLWTLKPRALPEHLWEDIARLACVDGGFTGCSLSLTSKYIRAATRATRFHSVALTFRQRPQQAALFLACLEAETARCAPERTRRPVVRHLYLASPGSAHADTRAQYEAAVRGLLRRVAPDLHSLVLARRAPNLEPPRARWSSWAAVLPSPDGARSLPLPDAVAATAFPALRELCLVGRRAPGAGRDWPPFAPEGGRVAAATLPKLTHLEVVGEEGAALGGWAAWGARGARLTHLRVSELGGCWREGGGLATLVANAFEERDEPEGSGFAGSPLPHLRVLLAQSAPSVVFTEALERLHAESGRRWAIVPIHPVERLRPEWMIYRLKGPVADDVVDWRDRLEGGPGRWRVEESWFDKSARCWL